MKKSNIVIKFNKEAIQSRTNEALTLKSSMAQDNFLNQFTYRSIVTDEMLFPHKKINTINFENLVGICYVQGLDKMALEEKKTLAKKMDVYDFVEYAYVEVYEEMKLPLNPNAENEKFFINKTAYETPDFTHLQIYKEGIENDHIGIDMEYAWSIGVTGEGIQIADIDGGFNLNHINLKRKSLIDLRPNFEKDDHATAVTGIMYGKDLGVGIKGMVHGADAFYFVSHAFKGEGRIPGIIKALEVLKAGDVFTYELQDRIPGRNFIPSDHNLALWDITQEALKAGILIIIAGGNGNENLDDDIYDEYRNRTDNGIIRVGAGDKLLSKAPFSTYGSMIHLQAWGGGLVTAGYGGLYDGGPNNNYTDTFSGTSSATPIVASAAVAVQSWYKQQTGKVLTPLEMRELLIATGVPQVDPEKGHIGPIPSIRRAIQALHARLPGSPIIAVIDGPAVVSAENGVLLSAEKSKSSVADIVSYVWQVPHGIKVDSLNQSTLSLAVSHTDKIQKILSNLAVTDAFGNIRNASYTLTIMPLPEILLWDEDRTYRENDIVVWKNRMWKAERISRGWEPELNSAVWRSLGEYSTWDSTRYFPENTIVSWKNIFWKATVSNANVEPGSNYKVWNGVAKIA